MPRPGVTILNKDAPPVTGPPIRTGTLFAVGPAERGSAAAAKQILSLPDFERIFGARLSSSYLYDAMDAFFREGGGSAYVSRVVAAAAVASTLTLNATGALPTITVTASSPGTWVNSWKVTVLVSGGTITLQVLDASGAVVEQFATTGGKAALLAYPGWQYVVLTDADPTKGDPIAVANVAFTGGTDGTIADGDWSAALARFGRGLGPGQVIAPGQSTASIQGYVAAHAAANNRVALLDCANGANLAALEAQVTALRAALSSDALQASALFGPWATVPGIVADTIRKVPYSAVQAGIEARRDREASPNRPAAGRRYPFTYVIDFVSSFTDADITTLLDYGVNIGKLVYGVPETYGYRSLSTNKNWLFFSNARLRMAVTAHGEDVGEAFVFEEIDGKGLKIAEFGAAITGMLLDFFNAGSLYGDTPADAFRVDVGPSVNTPVTIAAGELHAKVALRMSPPAEWVVIEFVKTPIGEAV